MIFSMLTSKVVSSSSSFSLECGLPPWLLAISAVWLLEFASHKLLPFFREFQSVFSKFILFSSFYDKIREFYRETHVACTHESFRLAESVIWNLGHLHNFLHNLAVFDDRNFVGNCIVWLKKVLEDVQSLDLQAVIPLELSDQSKNDLQDLGFNHGHKSGFFVQFYYFLQQLNCLQSLTA